MDAATILALSKQGMWVAFLVAAPILGASLAIGVLISIFQAATSISDATLNFAPKVVVAGLVFLFTLPWMIGKLSDFLVYLLTNIPNLIK